ncbi:MAG: alcohol dehydrogenase catalytic domain-containing protein [Propionibacteriaceae bacterium]|nr:alcohol dehydrogenase catalytic domain-containing protein [Propionibacteriaceae bacterium]
MRGVCLAGIGNVAMVNLEFPTRKAGEALLGMKAMSICGSDVKAYKGHGTPVPYPIVLGHEAVGEILEIDSENAAGLRVGDLVAVDPYLYCGSCYACSLGRTNCCQFLKCLGVHTDGCMSEFFVHPDHLLHKLPEGIELRLAALAEPLTIALHGIHRTCLAPREHIAIFGAGAIGLLAAMCAIRYGANPIVIDVIAQRLAFAKTLGVQHTLNPSEDDLEQRVAEITDGRMAEVVMEATGVDSCIHNTVKLAAYCGRVALTGWPNGDVKFDTFSVTRKELQILGARNSKGEFSEALELIASKEVDVDALCTETVPFEQLAAAVTRLAECPSDYLKIVGEIS